MWKIFLLNAKTQVILIANLPELYCIYCPFHQTFNEKYIIYHVILISHLDPN